MSRKIGRHFKMALQTGANSIYSGVHTIRNAMRFGHEEIKLKPLQMARLNEMMDDVDGYADSFHRIADGAFDEKKKEKP